MVHAMDNQWGYQKDVEKACSMVPHSEHKMALPLAHQKAALKGSLRGQRKGGWKVHQMVVETDYQLVSNSDISKVCCLVDTKAGQTVA